MSQTIPQTVLIVEDDQAVLELTRTILNKAGLLAETASSTAQALERFRQAPRGFDLLLTDVILPDGRGPDLVRQALLLRPDLKVVFMSGYDDEAIVDAFQDLGFDLIRKPFGVDTLLERVRAALGGAPGAPGA